MILKVGLTGGIASGKSTVAQIFKELGCFVVDADTIVSDLYKPGAPGHVALVQKYGDTIKTADGSIDRPKLAKLALSDPQGARELNALIHPLVIERQREILERVEAQNADRIAVVEATLLLESGGRQRFDRIVVVDTDPRLQRERGIARGLDAEEVERRMSRQMSREDRLAAADYVIVNDGSIDELRDATLDVFSKLVEDLARHVAQEWKERSGPESGPERR